MEGGPSDLTLRMLQLQRDVEQAAVFNFAPTEALHNALRGHRGARAQAKAGKVLLKTGGTRPSVGSLPD